VEKTLPHLFFNVQDSLKTDFSSGELWRFYTFLNHLSLENLAFLEFEPSYLKDSRPLDEEIRNITFDSDVAFEAKDVAILNGTDISGVATFGGRVVKNIGGRVIAADNARRSYDKTLLVADDSSSETVNYISRFFDIEQVVTKNAVGLEENVLERADITLILGFDIVEKL